MFVLYFDGYAKGNPGPAGYQYVILKGEKIIAKEKEAIGTATNNEAEYVGLINGLTKALTLGIKDLLVIGDSQLVIQQMRGNYAVRAPNLRKLYEGAKKLARKFRTIRFEWRPREQNKAGIGI